jgi:hypothetical protein
LFSDKQDKCLSLGSGANTLFHFPPQKYLSLVSTTWDELDAVNCTCQGSGVVSLIFGQ